MGAWMEKTALDLEGVPKQTHGNDYGVFMIMDDMCLLRRWWCIVLLENLGLEGYGRKSAHFTEEGKATLRDNVPPVFRITRKRKHESSTMSPQDTDPATDHIYSKRPYSIPPREQVNDNNDSMDQHDVVTTTRDVGILSEDASFDRLVERAQQAEHHRRVTSDLLVTFITQDNSLLQHLEVVIAGKLTSSWATSKGRVIIFFEEDEQLDRVLGFLTSLVEAQTTRCHNQVAFVMDVLLPEATVHALSTVHAFSIDRAMEMYKCGLQYDLSEKRLLAHYMEKKHEQGGTTATTKIC
ncbi:uncharacterized protein LOC125905439 [Epinephelus fuscoguttatus]|uniref:uncharacterized protein LOC125905439 n=1 Tax=Epinephelus fuscoguttatus TaxID=293821 RepID=UPI0020D039B9|nr:uncharacterized protein LOC125905439 [Epinephelus fuscoguttatus]